MEADNKKQKFMSFHQLLYHNVVQSAAYRNINASFTNSYLYESTQDWNLAAIECRSSRGLVWTLQVQHITAYVCMCVSLVEMAGTA